MTYESPITLIRTQTDRIIKEINNETDEVIFKAVVNVLPQVDKDELVKALAYDRGQYSKGYKDRDSEIVRCEDCRHRNTWDNPRLDPQYYRCGMGVKFRDYGYVREDDYCPFGKRREESEDEE